MSVGRRSVLDMLDRRGAAAGWGRDLGGGPDGARPELPPGAEEEVTAAVLAALATLRRPTCRLVAAATGYGLATVYDRLKALRAEGWVSWDPGQRGTMRATFEVLPVEQGCVTTAKTSSERDGQRTNLLKVVSGRSWLLS